MWITMWISVCNVAHSLIAYNYLERVDYPHMVSAHKRQNYEEKPYCLVNHCWANCLSNSGFIGISARVAHTNVVY